MENYILSLLVILCTMLPETELEPSGAGLSEEEPKLEHSSGYSNKEKKLNNTI